MRKLTATITQLQSTMTRSFAALNSTIEQQSGLGFKPRTKRRKYNNNYNSDDEMF